jgi:glycosyltransferase involved in cell wall biosynthesis
MTSTSAIKDDALPAVAPVSIAALIPAYKPNEALIEIVRSLMPAGFTAVVVIDDGSGPNYACIFDRLRAFAGVKVIRHAVNLGKGAALKTGMNQILVEYPKLTGVVTVDADGQHDPEDVTRVARRFAESPEALVLGAREFSGHVPLRSRLGNTITQTAMRVVAGQQLGDTQTGLRAIPRALMERMLKVQASGYEFELEMLIAAKHLGFDVIELPIKTIYEAGNPTSHFSPLRDSMRIYFVLLRFGFISMVTACLDNLVFYFFFHASGEIGGSLFGARVLALMFNYAAVRNAVFLSKEQHRLALPRYLLLAAANVTLSYALITFLTSYFSVAVIPAKISVESVLFIGNFAIQRDFVFARRAGRSER